MSTNTGERKREPGAQTWIEVSKDALKHNFALFRELIPKEYEILCMAKANAYGHGLHDYALAMDKIGVDWFGVDSITEALKLRKSGIKKPILILGYTLPERLEECLQNDVSLTVSSFETLAAISRLHFKKPFKIHLEISDRGRGFLTAEVPELAKRIKSMTNVEVESINADSTHPAGVIDIPTTRPNLVRIGVELMGYQPMEEKQNIEYRISKQIRKFENIKIITDPKLIPALSWRTIIAEVKTLPDNSKIALCPVGFWHGLPRNLAGKGEVLISGQRCKILEVSLDTARINVADIPGVKFGDVVTIIGQDGKEEISVCQLEENSGLTYYEIIAHLNPLIRRIYK
jgi:alanine racemase